jgi:hypothetical protein
MECENMNWLICLMAAFREQGNVHLESTKGETFLELLSFFQLW